MKKHPSGTRDVGNLEDLLQRARSGDRDATSDLLLRIGPVIRSRIQINPKWQSVLDVDDVMQVTYVEVFHYIERFTGNSNSLEAWIWRIAKHNLQDAIAFLAREKRPHPDARLGPPTGQDSIVWLYELVSGTVTTPSGKAMHKELREMLELALNGLPGDYAHTLRELYLNSRNLNEVAAHMNRSKGAIHLLRIRAIDRLREHFGSDHLLLE